MQSRHRVWQGALRVVGRIARWAAAAAAVALVAAATFEHVAAWRDDRTLARVGRSVDIGGRSLNIHCAGHGSPTVVFVSGRIAPGYVWTPVQRGVSAFTRACWYDRADIGWSDAGPDPAWGEQATRDLHALIERAPLERPLVLVGHSFGGYVVRLYHHAYRGEVSGMVLVDPAMEDAGRIRNMPHRDPPNLPRWAISGLSIAFGRLGMMRLLATDPGPALDGWTQEEWDTLARLQRRRSLALADAHVGPERATADQVRAAGGLEDLPLIVLTQGQGPSGWTELQREFAQRSRRGRQVLVPESGHGIPMEAPHAVVDAVREVVKAVSVPPAAGGLRRAPLPSGSD
jgi:pimeloyl-ACP methyl ester carboxylesterase